VEEELVLRVMMT